ncbi:hypothetical protein [Sporosarcina sp. NPDC096371]|uniref:hypothetical protein n=1 Tax=Sporosarcina sp. NPDC096371 TaxID=3364530 RepID=UPI003821F233
MKKTKSFLLGTTLAGALIVSVGFGTYSWFTSETQAHGEMVNGTLQINNGSDIDTPIFSGEKFTPSQLQYGDWITLSNSGDLDTHLKATYSHSVDKASLEEYEVGYVAMKYTTTPDKDIYEDSKIQLANLFKGTTNERSLSTPLPAGVELVSGILKGDQAKAMMATAGQSGEFLIGEGGEGDPFWSLNEGQYIDMMLGIKLGEDAGNDYQGAKYSATIKVNAKQTDDGAQY